MNESMDESMKESMNERMNEHLIYVAHENFHTREIAYSQQRMNLAHNYAKRTEHLHK